MFDLESLIRNIGYAGVAAIIFAENGLLIGFFLPGDSLLFTAGFLSSQGYLSIWPLSILLFISAVVGVGVGYWFGAWTGTKLFNRPNSRFFKRENLEKAHSFYERYGGKTIILARFIPIVRTFAPIIAGIAKMNFGRFMLYNIIGGAIWSLGLTWGGYWLGSKIPGIDRFLLPIIALIIFLSILPGLFHMLRTPEQRRGAWAMVKSWWPRK